MILNRYIIFRKSGAGERIATYDEGEEKEVLKELRALGKSYLVYDKVTDIDYTYTSFKKKLSIRDSFDIDPKNVFNTNSEDTRYWRSQEKVKVYIEYMTPEEYYEESTYIFQHYKGSSSNVRDLKNQRRNSKAEWMDTFYGATEGENKVEYLKKCILEGKKIDVPYLNYKDGDQEGLHRMMAAADIFDWDTKFPVLIIRPDKILTEKDMEESIKKWMDEYLDKEYIYDEGEFADKVWDIIEDQSGELNIRDIKVEIKFHSMNIHLIYRNEDYYLSFSLRNPKNLRESLFHIVEEKPINNEFNYGGIDDRELDELLEDPAWDL